MSNDAYDRLADALDALPNGFPRTESNVEVDILKRVATPGEANLASQLGRGMESVSVIAGRVGQPVGDVRKQLMQRVKRGLVWFEKRGSKPHFRLAPFVVGIYEAQLENMDHELAHLFEQYLLDGATEIRRMQPALQRVVPVQGAAQLQPKPESEIVPPPVDYAALEVAPAESVIERS